MPKIVIKEIDMTEDVNQEYLDHTVFVPGEATFEENYKLYLNVGDFEADWEGEDEDGKEIQLTLSENAKFAHKCLELGLPVLYYKVESENYAGIIDCFKAIEDKSLFDIRFITVGYSLYNLKDAAEAEALIKEMVRVAAVRGDSVAVCDVPAEFEKDSANIDNIMLDLNLENIDDFKYGMLIAPGFTCKEIAKDKVFPASLGYLGAYSVSVKKFPEWYAVAGSQRGILPFEDVKPVVEFGQADVDLLEPRGENYANKKSCNLICNIRPFGHIIWGNRTLLGLTDEGELKASNFLNIRQLCCILKKELYRICRKYTFEPNSDVLWSNFRNDIASVLDDMQSGNGIRGYKIEREAVAKKALLKAKIRIIPIEAVEDFELTVELADSIEVVE